MDNITNSQLQDCLFDEDGVVQGFLFGKLGFGFQNVRSQVWGVLTSLDGLGLWQDFDGDGQLVGGDVSVVSGVRLFCWESGNSLLHGWVFLLEQVVKLEAHLSVAGEVRERLGCWHQ